MSEVVDVFTRSLMITLFVFGMMLIVDYFNVLTKGKMSRVVKGGRLRQYIGAAFLGATPGCLGAFLNVSFYIRGLLTFGALVGGMIATSGDEAFVMLGLFPKTALLLFALLFLAGILFAWFADKLADIFNIVPCEECELAPVHQNDQKCEHFDLKVWKTYSSATSQRITILTSIIVLTIFIGNGFLGPPRWNWQKIFTFSLLFISSAVIGTVPDHFLKEHIWKHIIKEHLWRVFLWTFFVLFFINLGLNYWNLEAFIKNHLAWVLLLASLLGIIPESGPHLIFVMLFTNGLIPFSVLFASSFVQDGHGMLPLVSYTIRDSVLIKIFNLAFGLVVGYTIYLVGF